MAFDADNYVLDADGNRVLIGLTLEETREFERLDKLISVLNSKSPGLAGDHTQNQRRWLALYEKHRLASEPFLATPKTKH